MNEVKNDLTKEATVKKHLSIGIMISILLFAPIFAAAGQDKETFLVHLKTSLKRDDAQICVAYNLMLAALLEGKRVQVLVDADAINTYKIGWRGKDDIENYNIPENMRVALSGQFKVPLQSVPKTYGEYLLMLRDKGVEFYVNSGFLIVSNIGTPDNLLNNISAKFFRPVTLIEMIRLRTEAKYYMVY